MSPAPKTEGRGALQALNFFMADMQAGVGPFLGIFLAAHGWRTGPIGTVMTLGGVAGIVGAGGNIGAVAAGFLVKYTDTLPQALCVLGWSVLICAVGAALIRFSTAHKAAEQALYDEAVARRMATEGGLASAA